MRPSDWTGPYDANTWIHRMDPRSRIIGTVALASAALLISHPPTLIVLLICSFVLTVSAGFSNRQLVYRLSALLLFVLLLAVFMPLSVTSYSSFAITYSTDILRDALLIGAKAGFIMLIMMSLIGTIEPVNLGHALIHLHFPGKLVQMYLFTVRYFDILRREMQIMHTAMLARGFRPAANRHSLIHYGHMIGMLVVRSLDRSERVLRAMKCRGYNGTFHLYHHFHFHRRDTVFVLSVFMAVTCLLYWEFSS